MNNISLTTTNNKCTHHYLSSSPLIWISLVTMSVLTIVAFLVPQEVDATVLSQEADFNGDGFTDLAVGVPGENIGAIADAGAVNVIYGANAGLSATNTPDQVWSQNTANVEDTAETDDLFGAALASSGGD
jgi:FG-GAP repeat